MNKSSTKRYLQLTLTGIAIVWLFLKSPINPIYSEFTEGEVFSLYFSFFFWLATTTFVIIVALLINRKNYDKYSNVIFCITVFLWYFYFIPYGFDVTDAGFSLSKQWDMFNGGWERNFDYIAGTNFFGGLWLILFGSPFLIWARIGFVVLQTMICMTIFHINLHLFDRKNVFPITLSVVLSTSYLQNYYTINYDNLPFFCALLSIYFFVKVATGHRGSYNFLLSGAFSALAIYCRITYIIFLVFPIIALVFVEGLNIRKFLLEFLSGFAVCASLIITFMVATGGYTSYIYNFSSIAFEFINGNELGKFDHSFNYLYYKYISQMIDIVNVTIGFSVVTLIFGYVYRNFKKNKLAQVIITLSYSMLTFHYLFNLKEGNYTAVFGMTVMTLSYLSLWFVFCYDAEKDKKVLGLAVILLGVAGSSFAGSDLGILVIGRSSSVILILSFSIICLTRCSKYEEKLSLKFIIPAVLVALWALMFIGDFGEYFPYRDKSIKYLKHDFEASQLKGIKSNYRRVDVVDSLMNYLNSRSDTLSGNIFFTKSNALCYYLTNSVYYTDNSWDTLNDLKNLKKRLYESPPRIFVNSKDTHRYYLWPDFDGGVNWRSNSVYENHAQKYYIFYDEFITGNNYIEVYKNSFYTVYELKNEGGGDVRTEE